MPRVERNGKQDNRQAKRRNNHSISDSSDSDASSCSTDSSSSSSSDGSFPSSSSSSKRVRAYKNNTASRQLALKGRVQNHSNDDGSLGRMYAWMLLSRCGCAKKQRAVSTSSSGSSSSSSSTKVPNLCGCDRLWFVRADINHQIYTWGPSLCVAIGITKNNLKGKVLFDLPLFD
jgi:hypothetical protein